jgi:dihydroneopterin aldolase
MLDQVSIQGIEFNGYVGVTDEERNVPQPIRIDCELDYPSGAFCLPADTDDITQAIDYAKVVERVVQIGTGGTYRLLERLAEQLVQAIFAEFAIAGLRLWARKLKAPLKNVHDSVGVRIVRTRDDLIPAPTPAGFLIESLPYLPKGLVLDVAAGRGRNALYLASLGFHVDAIDRDEQALQELAALANARQLTHIGLRTIDLEPNAPHYSPIAKAEYHAHYDAVVCFFYLHRPLFPAIIQALKLGGVLVYETFLIDNHLHYRHPRRKEFCLEHNELLRLTDGLRVLHYEEGRHKGNPDKVDGPFTARLVAQKVTGST